METIGIKLADGSFYPVLQDGQPNEKKLVLTTANNNQTRVMVDLYRSTSGTMEDAEYVDTLQIDNLLEHPQGTSDILFAVTLDENNELSARIVDEETGETNNKAIPLIKRPAEERIDTSAAESQYEITEPSAETMLIDSSLFDDISESNSKPVENMEALENDEDYLNSEIFDAAKVADDFQIDADYDDSLGGEEMPSEEGMSKTGIFNFQDILDVPNIADDFHDVSDVQSNTQTDELESDMPMVDLGFSNPSGLDEPLISENDTENVFDEPSVSDENLDTSFDEPSVLEENIENVFDEPTVSEENTDMSFDEPLISEENADIPLDESSILDDNPETIFDEPSISEVPLEKTFDDALVSSESPDIPFDEPSILEEPSENAIDDIPVSEENTETPFDVPLVSEENSEQNDWELDSLPPMDDSTDDFSSNDAFSDATSAEYPFEMDDSATDDMMTNNLPPMENFSDTFSTNDAFDDAFPVDNPLASDDFGDVASSDTHENPFGDTAIPSETDEAVLDESENGEPIDESFDLPDFGDTAMPTETNESSEDESASGEPVDESFDLPDFGDTSIPSETSESGVDEAASGEPIDESLDLPDFNSLISNNSTSEPASKASESLSDDLFGDTSSNQFNSPNDDLFSENLNSSTDDLFGNTTSNQFDFPGDDLFEENHRKSDGFDNDNDFFSNDISNDYATNASMGTSDLYDANDIEFTASTSEDVKKKMRLPMVICMLCAIICMGAVVLLFFLHSSTLNILKNDAGMQVVQVEPAPVQTQPQQSKETFEQKSEPEPKQIPSAKDDEIVIIEIAEEVKPEPPEPPVQPPKGDIIYTVKWGDTLWDIAATYYKNPWRYIKLANYNGIRNPDYVISGTIILIPQE